FVYFRTQAHQVLGLVLSYCPEQCCASGLLVAVRRLVFELMHESQDDGAGFRDIAPERRPELARPAGLQPEALDGAQVHGMGFGGLAPEQHQGPPQPPERQLHGPGGAKVGVPANRHGHSPLSTAAGSLASLWAAEDSTTAAGSPPAVWAEGSTSPGSVQQLERMKEAQEQLLQRLQTRVAHLLSRERLARRRQEAAAQLTSQAADRERWRLHQQAELLHVAGSLEHQAEAIRERTREARAARRDPRMQTLEHNQAIGDQMREDSRRLALEAHSAREAEEQRVQARAEAARQRRLEQQEAREAEARRQERERRLRAQQRLAALREDMHSNEEAIALAEEQVSSVFARLERTLGTPGASAVSSPLARSSSPVSWPCGGQARSAPGAGAAALRGARPPGGSPRSPGWPSGGTSSSAAGAGRRASRVASAGRTSPVLGRRPQRSPPRLLYGSPSVSRWTAQQLEVDAPPREGGGDHGPVSSTRG
ncbi:unnamed protein product, partial [Prorocentrum cordatum]